MRQHTMTAEEMEYALTHYERPRVMFKKRGLHIGDLLKPRARLTLGRIGVAQSKPMWIELPIAEALVMRLHGIRPPQIAEHTGSTKSRINQVFKSLDLERLPNWNKGVKHENAGRMTDAKATRVYHYEWMREVRSMKKDVTWANHREMINFDFRMRYKNDVSFRIKETLRNQMKKALKGEHQSRTLVEYMGCSYEHLKQHIESQFTKGMTWENYGEWHIDHIMPKSLFNHTDEEEIRKAWNWQNLQPLWAEDNMKKRAKITEPQQNLSLCM